MLVFMIGALRPTSQDGFPNSLLQPKTKNKKIKKRLFLTLSKNRPKVEKLQQLNV